MIEPHSPFRHPYSSILIEMCPCHVFGWRRRKRASMRGERLCLTTEFLSLFPTNTYKVDKNVKKLAFDSSRIPNPRDEPNCNLSRIPTQRVQPNERLYKTCMYSPRNLLTNSRDFLQTFCCPPTL